jgi:peptidoglycan/xylan/chitin deacetylase (PgdA/CDA1 family)
MTPQEKALELLQKMDVIHYVKLYGKNKNSKGLPVSMHDDQIKQCALIAVDEIIEYINTSGSVNFWWLNYLEEVKQEINKL